MSIATKPKAKPTSFHVTPEYLDDLERDTDDRMEQIRKGKSRAKPTPTTPADLMAGVEVIEERDVEYSKILRSKQNPRTIFDEDLISEMAPSIITICQLNPLTIRENGELIDGETRHRAGQVAKVKSLRCKVIRCTDAQAACIRILTSLQRRDLNPIDRAVGIKALQEEHGLSQRQLEDVLKMKQGSMSNLTRLLDLPEEWRAKVISGEITATTARELCPWSDEPAVLKSLFDDLSKLEKKEQNLALPDMLEEAVIENSRPLQHANYYDRSGKVARQRMVNLKPGLAEREALRIRKVKRYSQMEERCFNVELWNTLQNADEQKREDRASKKIDDESGKPAPVDKKKLAENAANQKKIFDKRIYRFKIETLQSFLVEAFKKFDDVTVLKYALLFCGLEGQREREDDLRNRFGKVRRGHRGNDPVDIRAILTGGDKQTWTAARELVVEWVNRPFIGWHTALGPEELEILATHAGLDLPGDWPKWCLEYDALVGTYLELLNKDQLAEVAAEWNIEINVNQKRGEIIASMAGPAVGKPAPKALVNVKSVNLN